MICPFNPDILHRNFLHPPAPPARRRCKQGFLFFGFCGQRQSKENRESCWGIFDWTHLYCFVVCFQPLIFSNVHPTEDYVIIIFQIYPYFHYPLFVLFFFCCCFFLAFSVLHHLYHVLILTTIRSRAEGNGPLQSCRTWG